MPHIIYTIDPLSIDSSQGDTKYRLKHDLCTAFAAVSENSLISVTKKIKT
jgi:hypothetical protein